MLKLLLDLRKHKTALHALIGVNVKTTVSSTRFGWLWWLLNPLITMFIYYFFVGIILKRGGDNYHLFVLTGIVAWQMFSVAISGAIVVITNNKQLIQQVALPVEMLVLIPVLVQLFFGIVGVLIVLVWNYEAIGLISLFSIPLLILIAIAAYGIGLFLAVVNIYFKDTKNIIAYILRAGFFLSPILYPVTRITENDMIPSFIKLVLKINPMTQIIPELRSVLLHGTLNDFYSILILTGILLLIMQLGLIWIRNNSTMIVKML